MTDAVCQTRNKSDAQIEIDAPIMAQIIQNGQTNARDVFNKHIQNMQVADNYSPTHPQPFLSHEQMFLSAVHCADPNDVKAIVDPKNKNNINFQIDFWKSDTNNLYEQAKGHTVTPDIKRDAETALNHSIKADDRDQAVAIFNERAREDNQPFRINLNPQGKIEINATPIESTASK